MAAVAEDEPAEVAALAVYQKDGRAWVVADEGDHPVAYLLLTVLDGGAHVEQVSVHPDHARRGLGKSLLDTAADWARQKDLAALTLTTFADVPWNAPYYQRLGFRVLADDQLTPGLRHARQEETARGLDRWPRVAMRRQLPEPSAPILSGVWLD
jgi:GNAT superfamily N-acetyltransferase